MTLSYFKFPLNLCILQVLIILVFSKIKELLADVKNTELSKVMKLVKNNAFLRIVLKFLSK